MTNNKIIKKKIIYRSTHRGSKEMDILLGSFVNKYINTLTIAEQKDLLIMLNLEDDILYRIYFKKIIKTNIKKKKIFKLFSKFEI